MSFLTAVARMIHGTPLVPNPRTLTSTLPGPLSQVAQGIQEYHTTTGTKRKFPEYTVGALAEEGEGRITRTFNNSILAWGEYRDKNEACGVNFNTVDEKLARTKDRIIGHANYRVESFFGLACWYVGTNCNISNAKTSHQSGSANCGCCQAAHSCILPKNSDSFLLDLIDYIKKNGLDQKAKTQFNLVKKLPPITLELAFSINDSNLRNHLRVHGLNRYAKIWAKNILRKTDTELSAKEVTDILENLRAQQNCMASENSYISHVRDRTVQVSTLVNRYDCLIEDRMRKVAIWILNVLAGSQVPESEKVKPFNDETTLLNPDAVKDPYQATECFVDWMHSFFTRSKASIQKKYEALNQFIKAEEDLYAVEQDYRQKKVDIKTYLDALYTLHKKREAVEETSTYAPQLRMRFRLGKRIEIFDYISKTLKKEREECKDENKLGSLIQKWLKWAQNASPIRKQQANTKSVGITNLSKQKQAERYIFDELTFFEIFEMLGTLNKLQTEIDKVIKAKPDWKPTPIDADKYYLDAAMKIMELQKAGTTMPKLKELIGEGNKLDDFLMDIKYALAEEVDEEELPPVNLQAVTTPKAKRGKTATKSSRMSDDEGSGEDFDMN